MQVLDDMALLREYAANHSDEAFAELVSRRVDFVYSSALRQARDPIWRKKSRRQFSSFSHKKPDTFRRQSDFNQLAFQNHAI